MRISVTQLRAALLAVNLVLAGSLVYKALAAYDVIDLVLKEEVSVESHPAAVDLAKFVYRPDVSIDSRRDPASEVMRVSSDLQPPKPQPPSTETVKPIETTEAQDEPVGEAELPEGPLAKEWEYVYYIAWHGERGARNFAQIRKKEDKAAKSKYTRSSGIRSRTSTSTSTRARTSSTRSRTSSKYTKKKDSVSFLVSDRRIQNEEFDLDFWVHSADSEKLVYWMPGQPSKRYALPYQHEGSYLQQGPMRKQLRPEENEEDEEDEGEKKSFYIIHESADPEAAREQQYEEISAGKTSESKFTPSKGKATKPGARSSDSPSEPSASQLRPSASRPGGVGNGPARPTKEDIQELKSALDKIPAKEEQEKLKKELQGMLGK